MSPACLGIPIKVTLGKSSLCTETVTLPCLETYSHLYPDKEKMLFTQLNTLKVHGLSWNVSVKDQLLGFIHQFRKLFRSILLLIDIGMEIRGIVYCLISYGIPLK